MEAALSERPRSFLVEFTGLPGSGKSTLAHAVANRLRQGSEPIGEPTHELNHRAKRWQRMLSKVGWVLRCVVADPRGSLEAARSIASIGQRSLTDYLNTTFNMLYICGLRRALARRPGIQVLDQGFFQQVWSVRFSGSRALSPVAFARLGRSCITVAEGGAVIFVDVEPETALARLTAREGNASRLERRLSRETNRLELAVAGVALAEARAAVSAIAGPGTRVESFKNEDREDLEMAAEELARQVRAWSSASHSSG